MLRFFKAIRPASGYHTDQPPNTSKHTAELFAEVLDNGRILDNMRCVLGGTDILEAEIHLAKLFDDPVLQSHKMHVQRWPRDIELKKGLLSGMWKDLKTVVSARDASITDDTGSGIPAREFLEILDGAEEGHEYAAISWAVALGDDERLVLQLQGLPATGALLNRKPSFKRYLIVINDPQVHCIDIRIRI
jgi:hypothetical protein